MTVRTELHARAAESTIAAALRVGREPVINLLKRYGVQRASELGFSSLPEYIDEVETLTLIQPTSINVEFSVGERVKCTGYPRRDAIIVGYEVRYVIKYDGVNHFPKFGHRAEKLERVSPFNTIKPAPLPISGVAISKAAEASEQWTDKEALVGIQASCPAPEPLRYDYYAGFKNNY